MWQLFALYVVIGLLLCPSFYSDDGDSGGIVYTYISSTNTRYTVGVLRGRLGNDHNKTIYTKADIVLSKYGLERY